MNYMDSERNRSNCAYYNQLLMKNWGLLTSYISFSRYYTYNDNVLPPMQDEPLDLSIRSNKISLNTNENMELIKPTFRRVFKRETFNVLKCAACKSTFFSMFQLNNHFELAHPQLIESSSYANQHNQSKLTFKTHLADLRRNYSDLVIIDKLKCPSCNYRAKWPTELEKHVMVHSYGRPFSCYICSKSYKWIWDLGRHFHKNHGKFNNPYRKSNRCKLNKN